ncbi:MAG: hypothetical protein ABI945_07370 [Nitrospirales bacterium]
MEQNKSDEGDTHSAQTYKSLINLWTAGVRDYNSLLSDYLTANSIFVAAIGFLLVRPPGSVIFGLLIVMLCSFGILMALQMAIVLGRYSAQTALWEWRLRGIERNANWTQARLFLDLHQLRDLHETIEDRGNDPPNLEPNRATRQHRQWWARREISFPLFFGIAYGFFLIWGLTQLFQ